MCKNTHTRNTCLLLLFFLLPTAIQLNGLFWAASWALCAPHEGEEDTARHRQSIQACTTVLFNPPHSTDFSQAEIAGGKGAIERKSDRTAHLLQWECNTTKQNQRNTHINSILFVLCEHLIIIFIQIHCRSEAPGLIKWYECSQKTRAQQ